jgi:hypothetical protein
MLFIFVTFLLHLAIAVPPLKHLNGIFHQEYRALKNAFSLEGNAIVLVNASMVSLIQGVQNNETLRTDIEFQPQPSFATLKTIAHIPVALWLIWEQDKGWKRPETKTRLGQIRDDLRLLMANGSYLRLLMANDKEASDMGMSVIRAAYAFLIAGVYGSFETRFLPSIRDDIEGLIAKATKASLTGLHRACSTLLSNSSIPIARVWGVVVGEHMPERNNAYLNYLIAALESDCQKEGHRVFYASHIYDLDGVINMLKTHVIDRKMGQAIFASSERMHSDIMGPVSKISLIFHQTI